MGLGLYAYIMIVCTGLWKVARRYAARALESELQNSDKNSLQNPALQVVQ
jgi:hypothetical protein